MLKGWTDARGTPRYTVYVFKTLSLRGARYSADANDYDRSAATETVDLGLARVSYEPSAPSLLGSAAEQVHVLLRVDDAIGSSSVLLDKDTGALAEERTYAAYGAVESDDRPSAFGGLRDDVGFTGKEEDVEVGLQYFGARYLVTALGRWASPDPLALHGLGGDLNVYAYVHGKIFATTDPSGLCEGSACSGDAPSGAAPTPSAPSSGSSTGAGSGVAAPPAPGPVDFEEEIVRRGSEPLVDGDGQPLRKGTGLTSEEAAIALKLRWNNPKGFTPAERVDVAPPTTFLPSGSPDVVSVGDTLKWKALNRLHVSADAATGMPSEPVIFVRKPWAFSIAKSADDIVAAAQSYYEKYGAIDRLEIDAHGNPRGFELNAKSKGLDVTAYNAHELGERLKPYLAPNAQISLNSCNTGLGVVPQMLANGSGATVRAPAGYVWIEKDLTQGVIKGIERWQDTRAFPDAREGYYVFKPVGPQ